MERLKINQVAQELGVTPAGVYKRLKTEPQLVEKHIIKEKKATFLTREGVEILRVAMQKALPVCNSTNFQLVESQVIKHLQEVIANQQRTIDNLIGRQAEERQR
jgi:predicted transcriptional regulator